MTCLCDHLGRQYKTPINNTVSVVQRPGDPVFSYHVTPAQVNFVTLTKMSHMKCYDSIWTGFSVEGMKHSLRAPPVEL